MSNKQDATNQVANANLPKDAVALLVWRDPQLYGPSPLTLVVTRQSWDAFKQLIVNNGQKIDPDMLYHFDSPIDDRKRRTEFFINKIVSVGANFYSGVVALPGA